MSWFKDKVYRFKGKLSRPEYWSEFSSVQFSCSVDGWRSLVGCSPWDREESDMTERLQFHFSRSCIGEGNGSPLQCSCLENPRDRGAWWTAVYGVAQRRTQLKRLSSSSSSSNHVWAPRGVDHLPSCVTSSRTFQLLLTTCWLSLVVASGGYSPVAVSGFLSAVVSLVEYRL